MSDQRDGGIGWTDETWNPVRGCSRVSSGCEHCYAETVARRFSGPGQPYEGLVRIGKDGKPKAQWNGTIKLVPEHLDDPLRWRRPRRVFVNSMSDLFHENLGFEYIAAVFGVMAAAPTHTFQVLTKRPERAVEFFAWLEGKACEREAYTHDEARAFVLYGAAQDHIKRPLSDALIPAAWPLPNVWIGVSAEDQGTADERIPTLLKVPAAIRWVSYEPAIGPLRLREEWTLGPFDHCPIEDQKADPETGERFDADPCEGCPGWGDECGAVRGPHLDWIVVGGESGPGARPFDLTWARTIIRQCEETPVSVFVKQLGAVPVDTDLSGNFMTRAAGCIPRPVRVDLKHKKGADLLEWEEGLRVQEWPKET